MRYVGCVILLISIAGGRVAAQGWPMLAGDAVHSGQAPRGPGGFGLKSVLWTASADVDEQFVHHSSPVAGGGRVFVYARRIPGGSHVGNALIAFDALSGARLWSTPLEADQFESRSSPAVDERNQTVLVASGRTLYALAQPDGHVVWQRGLPRDLGNCSPIVTRDLHSNGASANRAFVSDYTGASGVSTLYAINLDGYDATHNPCQPGDIAWSAPLATATGATAAYADGVVVVGSYERVFQPPFSFVYVGQMNAFDALGGAPRWTQSASGDDGFFGGCAIHAGAAFAATYDFEGFGLNSRLFKFDLLTGQVVWSVPCERSQSIPVVLDDGRILLAAGIDGFGSAVRVQAFQDAGPSAALLWDTYADTNGDLEIGGWTDQPAVAGRWLYAGQPDEATFFGPYLCLDVLDLNRVPADKGFVAGALFGAGGSVAIDCGRLYSLGGSGLTAIDMTPACRADIDSSGAVDQDDLDRVLFSFGTQRGESGFDNPCDMDCDGAVDQDDLDSVLFVWGMSCP